jgi:hypothetical protein
VLDEGAVVGRAPRLGMRWPDGAAQEVEKWVAALARWVGALPDARGAEVEGLLAPGGRVGGLPAAPAADGGPRQHKVAGGGSLLASRRYCRR